MRKMFKPIILLLILLYTNLAQAQNVILTDMNSRLKNERGYDRIQDAFCNFIMVLKERHEKDSHY